MTIGWLYYWIQCELYAYFRYLKVLFLPFYQVASVVLFDSQCTRLICIFKALYDVSAPDLFNNFNLKLSSNYAYHRAKSDCISLCMDKWWVLQKNKIFRVILMHESPLKQNHPLTWGANRVKNQLSEIFSIFDPGIIFIFRVKNDKKWLNVIFLFFS